MSHPYLEVVNRRFEMKGEGAPKETVFGVLGHTKPDSKMKSLGGLVQNTKPSASMPKEMVMSEKKAMASHLQTDRHILGAPPKTHIPGAHFGQVPYPGHFMSALGQRL